VDNPYIPVRTETLEAQEYGLEDGEMGDDDGVEMYYKWNEYYNNKEEDASTLITTNIVEVYRMLSIL